MSKYDETDFSEEEDEWEDEGWEDSEEPEVEKENSKSWRENLSELEETTLRQAEEIIMKKEKEQAKEGYQIPKYGYPTSYVMALDILVKRMESLVQFMKKQGYGKGKYAPYYQYPHEEGKKTLRDAVVDKLSKEKWWNSMSPMGREKEVRKEMLSISLGTRGQQSHVLEESLSESGIIDKVDQAWKDRKDPVTREPIPLDFDWEDYVQMIKTMYPDFYQKWTFELGLFSKRLHRPSRLSQKEELSEEFKALQKQFPNASIQDLERMLSLRRQRR